MGLANLNGCVICTIDTETTGLKAGFHDVIEVAVVPLNAELRPITILEGEPLHPFNILLRPKRPENIDPAAMKVNHITSEDLELHGREPWRAAEQFYDWFQSLGLVPGKQIIPLAKNWAFDAGFLKDWLGEETFNLIFHYRVRELSSVLHFWNDRAEFQGEKPPFPKIGLEYVATTLEVKRERGHRALDDALCAAECYRLLMRKSIR